MALPLVEMAGELVRAQIASGHLEPNEMATVLQDTHSHLMQLERRENPPPPSMAAGEWRVTITRFVIVCLECDRVFKQLSKTHLREHGLTPKGYRLKYGIPKHQPLAATSTTAKRRRAVQATRPWEQTLGYIESRSVRNKQEAKR